jgi:pyridoxal phosphate enzyme (YggS family)
MTITKNLSNVTNRIENAALQANRNPADIEILAVTKTWPAEKLRTAANAGLTRFGENYLQEALQKIEQLQDLKIDWHFIGPIQSNKTKDIAQHFDWVQSVDRLKIAQRLDKQRPQNRPPLNVCIQVNIDNEVTKSGVQKAELSTLAKEISLLKQLQLRGIMVIPTKTDNSKQQQYSFHEAYDLYQQLAKHHPTVDTLSMGMSSDMSAAIIEGSTMVRIGTDLFGQRATPEGTGQVN